MTESSDQYATRPAATTASRRNLLGRGVAIAAAAAVVAVVTAEPAAAVDGDFLVIGDEGQLASSPTELRPDGFTGKIALLVNDTASFTSDALHPAMIGAWGASTAGLYAYSEGADQAAAYATSVNGPGLHGQHLSSTGTPAPGVIGQSNLGVGVLGKGNVADFEAGGNGFIYISKAGVADNPTGIGGQGAIARDAVGNLWYCYENGKWRKLAGVGTAGSFHPINPVRVYDSRAAVPAPGVMAPNTNRLIVAKDGRNAGGVVTAADAVPAGATAITFNVTATATTGPNYLSVVPGDATGFTTSTLNWAGGADIANGGTVKLDSSRRIKVFLGDQTGSAHVIVDVTGFYL